MVGTQLLHYKIVEKLGQGGMGEVYRARDTKLDRDVALKVLPSDMANDPERRMRFEREAKAVAALKHPNIVTIHSVEEDHGSYFISMSSRSSRAGGDSDSVAPAPAALMTTRKPRAARTAFVKARSVGAAGA